MQLEPDFFTLSAAFDALDDSLLQSIQHATAAEDRRSFGGDKDPSDVEGLPPDENFASVCWECHVSVSTTLSKKSLIRGIGSLEGVPKLSCWTITPHFLAHPTCTTQKMLV